MTYKSPFMRQAQERGFFHQCSDDEGMDVLLAANGEGRAKDGQKKGRPIGAYVGFDGTASSLHVGNLVSIMLLRLFQRCGHRPIVLLGGGTTRVGDPSGKEESRRLIGHDAIRANLASFSETFHRFLDFRGPNAAMVVDNGEWLDNLNHLTFLRDIGRHFSMSRMLSQDSVRLRLEREQNLSFLEFNYMVLQAYDFLEVSRRNICPIQMGGSDQWGNILCGVELGRRVDNRPLFALTCPLIVTSDGRKMGKTARGAVWLDAQRTSHWDYWQFWRNVADDDVSRFLKLFTDLDVDTIDTLCRGDINQAKKTLADQATTLCHGSDAAAAIRKRAAEVFEKGGRGGMGMTVPAGDIADGMSLFRLLNHCSLAASGAQGRRLVRAGAVRLNGEKVHDETYVVGKTDFADDGTLHLTVGKKQHRLLKIG